MHHQIEVRFMALMVITVFVIYIIFDQQNENAMYLEIRHINQVMTKYKSVDYPNMVKRTAAKSLRNNNESSNHTSKKTIKKSSGHNKGSDVSNRNSIPNTQTQSNGGVKRAEEDEQNLKWLDRSDSIPYRYYGDGTCGINTDRIGLMHLLRRWTKMAKKLRIRYFLDAGSLLGAWRDEEVIPYDSDLDIRVHNDDLMTLFNLSIRVRKSSWDSYDDYKVHLYFTRDWKLPYRMRRRFSCKGKEVDEYEGQCSFTDPIARLIYRQWHLDLYAYTDYHKTVKFLPRGEQSFRKSDILPLVRCDFIGVECRCPGKTQIVLIDYYSSMYPNKICKNKTWLANKS